MLEIQIYSFAATMIQFENYNISKNNVKCFVIRKLIKIDQNVKYRNFSVSIIYLFVVNFKLYHYNKLIPFLNIIWIFFSFYFYYILLSF